MAAIRIFRRWIKRLKLYLLHRLMNWEEWWAHNTPNGEPLLLDEGGKILKNTHYWQNIVAILENKPFLNELAEMQNHIDDEIKKGLLRGDDLRKIHDKLLILHGAQKINGVIIKADYELKKLNTEI